MDVKNLETASEYINNLLLSRGLLRDAESISFAHPSQAEGGKQATIAKVINLVHDLILRRDRESETLVKLSQDVSILRNTSMVQIQTISKLETRAADLERQVALKSATEKTATTNLRTAESRNKVLKEDMARLKATVGQIRGQCAHDLRKKEVELKRLQKYLEPKRGREGSVQVGVTVITPGASLNASTENHGTRQPSTSLLDETTNFLTQLARELSSENTSLRELALSTTTSLRHLQGIPEPEATQNHDCYRTISQTSNVAYEKVEGDLKEVLNQLGSLLTNPSFVPIEEVDIREEEIVRLREGWEKMETRWREALTLMNSWRKRMMETGDVINLDDLRKGLVLGSTPITLPPPSSVRKERLSTSHLPSPDDSLVEDASTSMSLDQQEDSIRNALAKNISVESPISTTIEERLGMGLFPASKVLRPIPSNTQRIPKPIRGSTDGVKREIEAIGNSPFKRRRLDEEQVGSSIDDILLSTELADRQIEANADLESEEDQEPPLTVEEKLLQAKRDAETASAAALKAISSNPDRETSPKRDRKEVKDTRIANKHPHVEISKPVKRTKVPVRIGPDGVKRTKRRSTLLPAELAGLIGA